jgi:hypothetical protein
MNASGEALSAEGSRQSHPANRGGKRDARGTSDPSLK